MIEQEQLEGVHAEEIPAGGAAFLGPRTVL